MCYIFIIYNDRPKCFFCVGFYYYISLWIFVLFIILSLHKLHSTTFLLQFAIALFTAKHIYIFIITGVQKNSENSKIPFWYKIEINLTIHVFMQLANGNWESVLQIISIKSSKMCFAQYGATRYNFDHNFCCKYSP